MPLVSRDSAAVQITIDMPTIAWTVHNNVLTVEMEFDDFDVWSRVMLAEIRQARAEVAVERKKS